MNIFAMMDSFAGYGASKDAQTVKLHRRQLVDAARLCKPKYQDNGAKRDSKEKGPRKPRPFSSWFRRNA
jgi:hypothetical protein